MVKHAPPWVALGGGGYSVTNVARAWSLAWAIMNDIHLPDDLPESMVGPLSSEEGVAPRLRDAERKSRRRDQCSEHMKETLRFLENEVFPLTK
jgi:acetoin utilization protein AcuC